MIVISSRIRGHLLSNQKPQNKKVIKLSLPIDVIFFLISKNELRAFLTKRYNSQIADKFVSHFNILSKLDSLPAEPHFDLNQKWNYKDFVNVMEITMYQNEEFYSRMVFDALDYNNDGFISEIDLFLTVKELSNDVFINVLVKDLVKIVQFISEKKVLKGTSDECKYNYEKIMKRVNKMNCTFFSSLSNFNQEKNETHAKSFFEFASNAFSFSNSKTILL